MMTRRINKPIYYEPHAMLRLAQRGITKLQVEAAIADPHSRRPAKRQGSTRISQRLNARETLTVIIEETPNSIIVVTAWI
jgi:hypothetical protein